MQPMTWKLEAMHAGEPAHGQCDDDSATVSSEGSWKRHVCCGVRQAEA